MSECAQRAIRRQLAAATRSKLHELDTGLVADILTWNEELNFTLFPSRMATLSLGMLGLLTE